MTNLNFTLDFEKLKEELISSNLNDVIKSTMIVVLNAYMERERDQYMKKSAYERDENRHDYRNGYYERKFTLNVGKVALQVPRTRTGNFKTELFEQYSRSDQAFILSMAEMVINGVSTRKVSKVMEQLCGEKVSKSTVSTITQKLDPVINEWGGNRPLNTMIYRYLYVDAMYIKVRENDKVVSKAVYIGLAVREDGTHDVIGLQVAQAESKTNWSRFFESLKSRGFQSPSW
ncbi:mobile element protein [Gracilibacillus boraciitolerans JCM 21714]|uniref:Mutator family transposase n=1 Tax=Gracilibacillus boraciitolerans JCM 21714 TaxID=1298598 RepID=W4VQT8_9BACI|nr:transposase [Gracilibacillus boraciitolerans]GAE95358.1 mobile element protein [Gracilibacillus boraciitolerans JCM 21714]